MAKNIYVVFPSEDYGHRSRHAADDRAMARIEDAPRVRVRVLRYRADRTEDGTVYTYRVELPRDLARQIRRGHRCQLHIRYLVARALPVVVPAWCQHEYDCCGCPVWSDPILTPTTKRREFILTQTCYPNI